MTLRDYFAAKAMAAILPEIKWTEDEKRNRTTTAAVANASYSLADAMLKERGYDVK